MERPVKKVASGPISRILCHDAAKRNGVAAAIIPLGRRLLDGSSGLPEGPNGPGSPPLLFGLAPRGVCRAPDVATGAVGSYPTFSPLPSAAAIEDLPEVSPPADHRGRCAGGIFSVALSVAEPSPARPPGVTRRAALRSPDFPPATCPPFKLADTSPAITRPARYD